jgi:hypothetical protein
MEKRWGVAGCAEQRWGVAGVGGCCIKEGLSDSQATLAQYVLHS